MKTSNKILLGLFALGLLAFFAMMVFVRMNLQPQGIGSGNILIEGSGTMKKETRSLSSYTSIQLGHDFEVILWPDSSFIALEMDDNLLPLVETKVEKSQLKLKIKEDHSLFPSQKIKVTIGVPKAVNRIVCGGIASVQSLDTLQLDSLFLSISGNGVADLHCQSDMLWASISGSGQMTLKGQTGVLSLRVAGSGNLQALDLQSRLVKASISGSGNAHVNASYQLDADIGGSGVLYYQGKPEIINKHIGGSGRLREL